MKPIYIATATSTGRDGRAVTSDNQLDLQLAMPPELGGPGNGVNPEQLFAVGWAACFATSLKLVARHQGLDASDSEVTAEVGLVRKKEGPGFALVATLRVRLPSHLSGETKSSLVQATHNVCPYSNATRGNVPVDIRID